MKLELSQQLTQTTTLEQGLVDEVKTAMKIWETKKPNSFSISKDDLISLFKSDKITPEKIKSSLTDGENLKELPGEFVFVSKEEMEELDPDEQIGYIIGNFIFISEDTPEDYLPFVLLNLRLLAYFSEVEAKKNISRFGIDIETQKHWTANTFDIIVASKAFREKPEDFINFLKWRKEKERTAYFDRVNLNDALSEFIDYKRYKKTTHPNARSKWTRMSWNKGMALSEFSSELKGRNRNQNGISRVDFQIMELSKDKNFDPNAMLSLLERIISLTDKDNIEVTERTVSGFRVKTAKKLKLDDKELLKQAYLLTEQNLPGGHLLEELRDTPDNFIIVRHARSTASALIDRISYFSRKKLISEFGPGIIASLKSISVGNGNIDEESNIDDGRNKLASDLKEIEDHLKSIEEIELKFKKLRPNAPEELIPLSIVENKKKLLESKGDIADKIMLIDDLRTEIDSIGKKTAKFINTLET